MKLHKLLKLLLSFYSFNVAEDGGGGEFTAEDAGAAFAALDNPHPEKTADEQLAEKAAELEAQDADEESDTDEDEADTQEQETITVEVDGKKVELTPEQVAEAYKSGLRQSDYSRKTAELAQQRSEAQVQADNARQERDQYAQRLNNYAIQLQGLIAEQSQINWQELLDNDPIEYLKQQQLLQNRQATFTQANQERQYIEQLQAEEQRNVAQARLADEGSKLLEVIPQWKDENKAKAEKEEIKQLLSNMGFSGEEISQVQDHRTVKLLRDALNYQKLLKNAPAATKKVTLAPTKTEKSGVETKAQNDVRKQAMKNLQKSGNVNDAIKAFETFKF